VATRSVYLPARLLFEIPTRITGPSIDRCPR
jgi:hypothetical protein